jgi:predicted nucleic acid-binding Zn ribbon protein
MSEQPEVTCPNCGASEAKRLFSGGAGLIFKGSGFYITDYKNKSNSTGSNGSSASSSSEASSNKESTTKSEGSSEAGSSTSDKSSKSSSDD